MGMLLRRHGTQAHSSQDAQASDGDALRAYAAGVERQRDEALARLAELESALAAALAQKTSPEPEVEVRLVVGDEPESGVEFMVEVGPDETSDAAVVPAPKSVAEVEALEEGALRGLASALKLPVDGRWKLPSIQKAVVKKLGLTR